MRAERIHKTPHPTGPIITKGAKSPNCFLVNILEFSEVLEMTQTESQNGTKLAEPETLKTVDATGRQATYQPANAPVSSYGKATPAAAAGLQRPGWVVFAAVMTFTAAIGYGLISLTEFGNSTWFVTVGAQSYSLFSSHFFWWAVIDLTISLIAITAGVSLLRGGAFGLLMGITGASVSMIRWMFYIPASPWLALTIIFLDILVITGLCLSTDWFEQQADTASYDS
jgi:hypothetical protein